MTRILLIAIRSLFKQRRRTMLLGGAIISVTALLVLLGSVGNGIRHTMLNAGSAMITGHVNVGGFYKITAGQAIPAIVKRDQLLKDVKEIVPEAKQVLDRRRGWGKVVSESDTVMSALVGIDARDEHELAAVISIVEGDFADLSVGMKIMLFQKQAERLGVKVGDQVTLSAPIMKGQRNSVDVEVAAIAKDMGLISIMSSYVTKPCIAELYQMAQDTTGVVFIYLDDPYDSEDIEANVRAGLLQKDYRIMDRQEGAFYRKFEQVQGEDWTGQKLDLTTWEDELAGIQWTMKTFDTVTTLLIGILLVIIIVGVMNTTWISVRDRTREIGTLRAIGMGQFKILMMFVMEMAILTGVASVVGVFLGFGLTAFLNALNIPVSQGFQIFLMSETLRMVVEPSSAITAVIVIPLLTTLGAMFPALHAARMRPVTAMHHVG